MANPQCTITEHLNKATVSLMETHGRSNDLLLPEMVPSISSTISTEFFFFFFLIILLVFNFSGLPKWLNGKE